MSQTHIVLDLFKNISDRRKECNLLYSQNNRPTGNAQVLFSRTREAKMAREEYNHVPLDGRKMVRYSI